MIYHRQSRFVLPCLLLILGWGSDLYGQAAPLPLPATVLTAPDATTYRSQINGYVAAWVARLASPDANAWSAVRGGLVNVVTTAPPPSPSFMDEYALAINQNFQPLATNKDARYRLNIAIIVLRVAAKAGNGRLAPITTALLHDDSDAVVLWGLQSAKYVAPALLQSTNFKAAGQMGQDVLQAVKSHVGSGAIVEEGYRALTLDPTAGTTGSNDLLKSIDDAGVASYVPNAIALLDYRVKMYEDSAPAEPITDTWAITFFIKAKVWGVENSAQQGQTMQLMLGLLKGASKQLDTANSTELRDVLRRTGQAFEVLADKDRLNNPGLRMSRQANFDSHQ